MSSDSPLYSWKNEQKQVETYVDGPPILPGTVSLSTLLVSAKQKREFKERQNDGPWYDWRSAAEISGKKATSKVSTSRTSRSRGGEATHSDKQCKEIGTSKNHSSENSTIFPKLPNLSRRVVSQELFPAARKHHRNRRRQQEQYQADLQALTQHSVRDNNPSAVSPLKIAVYKSSSLPTIGRRSTNIDLDPIKDRNRREIERRVLLNQF